MFFLQSGGSGGGKWYLFVQLTWGLLGLCKHSYNSIKSCYQIYSSSLCSKSVMGSRGVLVPHSFNSTAPACSCLRLTPGDSDLHRHESDWYLIPTLWFQRQYGLQPASSHALLFSVPASGGSCRAFKPWISQTLQPRHKSNPQCSPAGRCLLGGCSLMRSWGAPFFHCLKVPHNPLGIYSDTGQLRDSFGSEYWREGDKINNSRQWWLQCPTPTASFTMCSVSPPFTTELSTQAIIETDLAGDCKAFLIKPEGWPECRDYESHFCLCDWQLTWTELDWEWVVCLWSSSSNSLTYVQKNFKHLMTALILKPRVP